MRPLTLTLGLITLACSTALAAEVAPADVLLNMEIEEYGVTSGMNPVQLPDASGEVAMALAVQSAGARGAVKLPPGKYLISASGAKGQMIVDVPAAGEIRFVPE